MTLIALTGPTGFQQEVHAAIEDVLEANFVNLNQHKSDNVSYWLDAADGVILPGGVDLHPSCYEGDVVYHHNLTRFDRERDRLEANVIEYCLTNNKPLLGICRGHQRIAAYFGVALVQDLFTGKIAHSPGKDMELPPEYPAHRIKFLLERDRYAYVNSYHHQGVHSDDVSRNANLTALAVANDKVCEMMEVTGSKVFSVQWHPEGDYKSNWVSMDVWRRFKDLLGQ